MPNRTTIEVRVDDGSFELEIVAPESLPAAGVVIVPSIFGLNEEADRWLREYSAAGFLAAVYDPFWRTDPGALSVTLDEDRVRAKARRDGFAADDGIRDLRGAIETLRALPENNGNVAVPGYCFGGRYALIAAARLNVQAAVAFHGIRMGDNLDDARAVRVPVSFHFGDDDHSAPMSEVRALIDASRGNRNVELCVYPGVGHSFTWHGHPLHDPAAEAESWRRAMAVLAPLQGRRDKTG
jgi:carboxymethylenebutenolidase